MMLQRCAAAMQASKAWPAVFDAGSAEVLARAVIETLMTPTKPMVFRGMDAMARDDLEPTEDEFRGGFVAALRSILTSSDTQEKT